MSNHLARILLALTVGLAGCFGPSSGQRYDDVTFPPPPAGIAPQPYTAEEIRASNPEGTFCEYRISQAGMAPIAQSIQWTECNSLGCAMVTTLVNDGGGKPRSERTTARWDELRDHASFPAALTVRTEELIATPAGRFACWRYDVRRPGQDAQPVIERYWFDARRAGSPVLMVVEQARVELMRMELTATNRTEFR
ncbi:hypothetical protein [Engelhardtia mirabilis]